MEGRKIGRRNRKRRSFLASFPISLRGSHRAPYLTSDYTPSLTTPQSATGVPPTPHPATCHHQRPAIPHAGNKRNIPIGQALQEDQRRLFSMDHTLDVSLQTLVNRCSPSAPTTRSSAGSSRNMPQFVHGTVNQAYLPP